MSEESLKEYRKKRNFEKTTEPQGTKSSKPDGDGRIFVVQKHDASRLHYDFRLELNGVLVSWAIPKGPSLDTKDRRLAVPTEDHPLDYAGFEGTIPQGEYGGGTVMVWDTGRYHEIDGKDIKKGLEDGRLEFFLDGKKLKGGFTMLRTNYRGKDEWLLIKMKDEYARSGYDITAEMPDSATTGRNLDQIKGG